MELGQLRTFLAVIEHGSFSRAGQALRLGQSTVSFHIQALEASAGARLLDRRNKAVRVTPAGSSLRRYATRIVSLHDEALARIQASEEGQVGSLAIAASTVPGEFFVPPILAAFRREHPAVTVSVSVSDSRKAILSLLAQESELALVGARQADKRILFAPLFEDEIVLVGPASSRPRVSAEELATLPLILREEGSGTRAAAGALTPHSRSSPPVLAGSATLALRCVAEGVGHSFVSRVAAEEWIKAGSIRLVKAPGTPLRRCFYSARLRQAAPSGPLRAFLSIMDR